MSRIDLLVREKCYPGSGLAALANLELKVPAGEFVAIVGPSGAGKTTLLNLVAGLDRAFDGQIRLGAGARGAPPASLGYVFQEPRLMPWLSVLENVRLVLNGTADGSRQARRLLEAVGMGDCFGRFPGQLSGGMQRRVALARAFAVRPSLLLLDEPFGSLDAPTATQLRKQLLALWRAESPTVLMVTHDLCEALALADRVIFLSHKPARVILDYRNRVMRTGDTDTASVSHAGEGLLRVHPELLAGIAGGTRDEKAKRCGNG